ncbi:MAG TPA: hypothetical protein VK752_16295 [Bryobacteraceae bacterium]|jgi:hypothetical protein|nr:hypothetical protein [Bryobacteraceae bacterium]
MKTSIVRTLLTLSISAILSPVALLAQDKITATIPFDFTVGAKTFSAGDYSVQRLNQGVLLIQNMKHGTGVMTMVLPGESNKAGVPVITFNRYGNRYFLSQVSNDSQGWRLRPSKVEKELIAQAASPRAVILAAALYSK